MMMTTTSNSLPEINTDRIGKIAVHDADTTDIRELVVRYDVPHHIANLLIGKREQDTKQNIVAMMDFLDKRDESIQNTIMASISEEYRKTVKKIPKVSRRSFGRSLCFGFTYDDKGVVVRDKREYVIIKEIIQLSAAGYNNRAIAEMLNSKGLLTRTNKEWTLFTVSSKLNAYKRGAVKNGFELVD